VLLLGRLRKQLSLPSHYFDLFGFRPSALASGRGINNARPGAAAICNESLGPLQQTKQKVIPASRFYVVYES
jgi:hypothetical protein